MAPEPIAPRRPRVSPQARARSASARLAVGYVRCSTEEQAVSGLGLEAQRVAITDFCEARGLTLVAVVTDAAVSGTVDPDKRPGMVEALAMLADGRASTLVASKTDRLSRSMPHLYGLMDRSVRGKWTMLTADGVTDTSTTQGRMMAGVAGLFAEYERELIAQRTKDALAVKKAGGSRLGRPVAPGTEETRLRVRRLHNEGHRAAAIAAALNADGLLTPTGLTWTSRHVWRMLDSLRLDDEAMRTALL